MGIYVDTMVITFATVYFFSAASEHKDSDVCKIVKDEFLKCVLHFEIPEKFYTGI